MNRYEITLRVDGIGKVSHVIQADDLQVACDRALNAHKGAAILKTKKLDRAKS